MSILYITSNANSGDGTLRTALAQAVDGDIIQPSAEDFPSGTDCEILLTSNLAITKGVTIRGAQTKLRLTANGAACYLNLTAEAGSTVTFEDVEFVALKSGSYGGVMRVYGPDKVICRRCLVVGNSGKYGGFAHVSNYNPNVAIELYDSAFYGNYASTQASFIYFQGPVYKNAKLIGCTYAANVCPSSSAAFNYTPVAANRIDNVTSTAEWLMPPSADYSAETWTKDSWRAMDPRLVGVTTKGTNEDASYLDLAGNFRRSIYDDRGPALGAYEVLEPDLYWIGLNENGEPVAEPRFAFASGWATTESATACGSNAPADGQTLCIPSSVTFLDQPPLNSTVLVTNHSTVVIENDESTFNITLGIGSQLIAQDENIAIETPQLELAPYSNINAAITRMSFYPLGDSLYLKESSIRQLTSTTNNYVSPEPYYQTLHLVGVTELEEVQKLGGKFNVGRLVIRSADAARGYIAFEDYFTQPEIHCESFVSNNVMSISDVTPTVYPRQTVNIAAIDEDISDDYLFDLSELNSDSENRPAILLRGQKIQNIAVPITLSGSATVANQTVDFSYINATPGLELALQQCVVSGQNLEVDSYKLAITGGSLEATYISVVGRNEYEAKLTLDGMLAGKTISALTVNNATFHAKDGRYTIYTLTTINATLIFDGCQSVVYNGVIGQASVTLTNVSLAQANGLSLSSLAITNSMLGVSGPVAVTESTTLNSATLDFTSGTFGSVTALDSTITFADVFKGTSGAITHSTITGSESSRLSFSDALTLIDSNASVNAICSMSSTEYESLATPTATTPFSASNGAISCDKLTVYPTETYELGGALTIATIVDQGTIAFTNGATLRADSIKIAETGSLTFPENGIESIESSSIDVQKTTELRANSVVVEALGYSRDVKITAKDTANIGELSPANSATLEISGEEILLNNNAKSYPVIKANGATITSESNPVRVDNGSEFNGEKITISSLIVASGSCSLTAEESVTIGECQVATNTIGSLAITAPEITLASVAKLALAATFSSLSVESLALYDGTSLQGGATTIGTLTSESATGGNAQIVGSSIAIANCEVDSNLTLSSTETISGALNTKQNGSIVATGTDVTATIGSGVELSCTNLNCSKISPSVKATSITALNAIKASEVVANDELELAAASIELTTAEIGLGKRTTLSNFTTAKISEATVVGELICEGTGNVTIGALTCSGTTNIDIEGDLISDSITAYGPISVQCGAITADVIEIESNTTSLIAQDAMTANSITVAANATLALKKAPETLTDLLVEGTLELEGGATVRVTDQTALGTVKNTGSTQVEFLLSTSLDVEPTTIGNVVIRTINGTATEFRATVTSSSTVLFTWKSANDIPCTIEEQRGEEFVTVVRAATPVYTNGEYLGSYEIGSSGANGKVYRLYDGAKYLTDLAFTATSLTFYTCEKAVAKINGRYESAYFFARIANASSGTLLLSSDVESATATLYKIDRTSVSSKQRKAVANWTEVAIAPQIIDELESNEDYNFAWIPRQDVYPFVTAQGSYMLQVRIKLTNSRPVVVASFEFKVN